MAKYVFNEITPVGLLSALCPYRVIVKSPEPGCDPQAEEWMLDPNRPGLWYWSMEDMGDFKGRWALNISDPDVAFEAKIRWG